MAAPEPLPPGPAPTPATDLVASLPAPVLRLLILFGGPIATLRSVLEVLSWKPERRVESYILVGVWWGICLGGKYAFMWLLPPLLFLPLFPLRRLRLGKRNKVHPTPSKPATTETLLLTLGDLHKIYALLPPSPTAPASAMYARFKQLGPLRLVRGLLLLWVAWIVAGQFLGLPVLLALVGTVVLLLPSPPLAHVVHLLGKSLAVRRLAMFTFLVIFGTPDDRDYTLGSPLGWFKSKWRWSRQPAAAVDFDVVKLPEEEHAPADRAGNPIYFRFELFENQRWWMGLDWTSALLPQERPSWCDAHLLPVSPPVAFTLPPPTSIDLPAPTKSEPRAQVRRTATWRWLDDDWIVYKKTGDTSVPTTTTKPASISDESDAITISPAEPKSSTPKPGSRPSSGVFGTSPEDSAHIRAPSLAEAAFAKGLGRLKAVAPLSGPSGVSPTKAGTPRARTASEASSDMHVAMEDVMAGAAPGPGGQIPTYDEATDNDGWVYGDNKWENMGAKGGLGKVSCTIDQQLTTVHA